MNGARWLVQALEAEGVDTLFGYPGGTIMPFYDALHGASLKHVLVRHEQGAAFAANGYARASGRVGVCVATSGPGASNLVTGIADAMFDSVPMVVLTGQVPTFLMGTDAFQELDVFGMTMPIVKHSFLPRSVDELPAMFAEAFRIARSGRPGPVLIDLPKDVQMAAAAHLPVHSPLPVEPVPGPPDASLHEAAALRLGTSIQLHQSADADDLALAIVAFQRAQCAAVGALRTQQAVFVHVFLRGKQRLPGGLRVIGGNRLIERIAGGIAPERGFDFGRLLQLRGGQPAAGLRGVLDGFQHLLARAQLLAFFQIALAQIDQKNSVHGCLVGGAGRIAGGGGSRSGCGRFAGGSGSGGGALACLGAGLRRGLFAGW